MSNGTDHKVRRVAVATLVLFIVNVPLDTRKMHESQSQMDSISNEFTDSVRISKIETPLLKPLSSSDEPPLIIRKGTDIRNEIDVYCKGYDCEVRKRLNRITTDSVPNHTVFYALNADANSQGSGVPQMAQLVNITMQHTAKREKTLSEVDYRSNINTLLDAVSTIKLSEARYGTLGGSSDLNIALPVDRSLHLTAEFLEVTPSFRSEEGEKKLQIFQTGTSADSSPVLRIQELFSHLNSKGNSVPDGVLKSSLASLSLPVNKYRNPLFDSSKGQKFNKKYLHPSPVDKMEDVNLPQRKCVKRRKSVNLDLLNADAITSDMANAASSTAEQKIACASVSHSHKKIDFINKVYKYPRELKSFGSIFNNFNPQKTYQQKSHFNDLEVTNPNYGYDMPTWSSSREIEPIEVPSTPEDSSKYFTDNQEDSNSDDDISATNESPNSLSSTSNESNPENAGSTNANDMTTWSSSGEIEPNEVISTSEDSRKYFTVNQEDSNSDDDISATNESPNSLSSTNNESNPENAGSTNANDMTTWSSSGEIEPNEVTSTSDDSPKYFTRREGDSDSNDTINKTNDSLTFMPRQENLIPVNTPADSTPNQHISTLPTLTSSTSTSTPSRSSLRVQSNLPPFFWRTNTTKDVLPPDYFMESEMAKDQKQSTSQSHKNPIKPLLLNMKAALVPMTSRQLGLLPTCMLMAAWYIILLAIGAVTALAAIKKRSKLYNRKQVYAVILACRLNDRRMKSKRGKRSDVKINLEPNLCKYVVLHRQHLTIDVFENLRTMIDKFSEYQNMVDMYVNIKETGDQQKLDTMANMLTAFFRKERNESVTRSKMLRSLKGSPSF
uniref:Uncharacterized protein n=2 Tax=Schistocephalus solidus TaxID=70667 RepID=A0A0X3PW21_SCHSO